MATTKVTFQADYIKPDGTGQTGYVVFNPGISRWINSGIVVEGVPTRVDLNTSGHFSQDLVWCPNGYNVIQVIGGYSFPPAGYNPNAGTTTDLGNITKTTLPIFTLTGSLHDTDDSNSTGSLIVRLTDTFQVVNGYILIGSTKLTLVQGAILPAATLIQCTNGYDLTEVIDGAIKFNTIHIAGNASLDLGGSQTPSAPLNVAATQDNAQTNVTWTTPASNGGMAISGYTITLTSHADASTLVHTVNSTTFASLFTGLANGTTYDVAVVATNAVGNGPAGTTNVTTITPASPSVNRNRPFNLSTSSWNLLTPSTSVFQDENTLHKKLDNSQRIWYIGTTPQIGSTYNAGTYAAGLQVWWGKVGDPTWSFVVPQFKDLNFNRDRPSATWQQRGPSTMQPSQTDSDHIVTLVDSVTGDYSEIWLGMTDTVNHIAMQRPVWVAEGIASATSGTAGSTGTLTASGFGTLTGDVVICGGKFLQITSNTSTVLTGTAGWKNLNTGETQNAPSPAPYMITNSAGVITSGGGTTTISDSTKSWGAHQWQPGVEHVVIAGLVWGIITDNTSTSVTVSSWLNVGTGSAGTAPTNGTPYMVSGTPAYGRGNAKSDGSTGVGAGTQNAGARAANYAWLGGAISGYDCTNGRSTSVGSTTLTDTGSWQGVGWPTNVFTGYIVTAGSTSGQADVWANILSNTGTVLTIDSWKKVSDNTSASNPATGAYWITNSTRSIDHAIAIALPTEMLSNAGWTAPATAPDNGGHSGPITMGMKVAIPSGTAKPTTLSFFGSMLWDNAVKYGWYVGDFVGADKPLFYADGQSIGDYNTQRGIIAAVWYYFYGGANVDAGPNWDQNGDMAKIEPALRLTSDQPCFLAASPPGGTVNTAYSYTFKATSSRTLSYTVISGTLPPGLTLNSSTGVLSGTPTGGSGTAFVVRASDGFNPNVSTGSLSVSISSPGVITAVRQNNGGGVFSGTTNSFGITANAVGNRMVAFVATDVGISTITDNSSGSWSKAASNIVAGAGDSGGTGGGEIWIRSSTNSCSNVTVTLTGATASICHVEIVEFSNLASSVDKTQNTGATSNHPGTGSFTPNSAGTLMCLAANTSDFWDGSTALTNSWTSIGGLGHKILAYKVQTGGPSADSTQTTTFGSNIWAGVVVAYNHT